MRLWTTSCTAKVHEIRQHSPVLTCRFSFRENLQVNIALGHIPLGPLILKLEYRSGAYQLDANGGSFEDQFKAQCVFSNLENATCLKPQQVIFRVNRQETALLSKLLSKDVANAFEYGLDASQLRSLIDRHRHGNQTITFIQDCDHPLPATDELKLYNSSFSPIPESFLRFRFIDTCEVDYL